jgi:hypothetical protein
MIAISYMKIREHIKYLPFYLFFFILWLTTVKFPFFWDTIQLASKHAHFFYESNFSGIILPNEIDSGHIPALGIYLALVWKIAGKSLVISHLAMLPFVMGIVYQTIILTRGIFSARWHTYALVILLADATLLAQCTLVSPDVFVIFFFIMALNNQLRRKELWYSVALAGLTLSSMRGMMCVAGLFLAEIIMYLSGKKIVYNSKDWRKTAVFTFQTLKLYLPAIIIAGTFFVWHYSKTGWIGYHINMPWYPLFEPVNFKGAIWNTFILGWRMIDFGRIFVWVTGFFCLWYFYKKRPAVPDILKQISVILLCIFLALFHAAIFHKNLSGHRYFLPVYFLFTLLVTFYLFEVINSKIWKKTIFYLLLTGMLSGNFWVYPDHIAKGWDSTLAYLPYFPLREKMINFMEKEGIGLNETGTLFPNTGQLEYLDLSGKKNGFAELDLKTNHFVFYSNIYNGFSDNELTELKNSWKEVKVFRFMKVKIILYASPCLKNT